jgi:hypothetical protein
MRDTVAPATGEPASTTVVVWHWDPRRERVVWVGAALLSLLGLPDAAAFAADPAREALAAASARAVETGSQGLSLQRPSRHLHGVLVARRMVLAGGAPGWRVEWTVRVPRPPSVDPTLAGMAFEALPMPAALCGEDGLPIAMNPEMRRFVGDAPPPLDGDGWCPAGWAARRAPLDGGVTLLVLVRAVEAAEPGLDAATLDDLAASMRSPLTAILGFVEFLAQTNDDLSAEKRARYLGDVAREAKRLGAAIDALEGKLAADTRGLG